MNRLTKPRDACRRELDWAMNSGLKSTLTCCIQATSSVNQNKVFIKKRSAIQCTALWTCNSHPHAFSLCSVVDNFHTSDVLTNESYTLGLEHPDPNGRYAVMNKGDKGLYIENWKQKGKRRSVYYSHTIKILM